MDNNSEARLMDLHPVLARKVRKLAEMVSYEGIELRVTVGFRTRAQQHALWLQGRASLLEVNAARANTGLAPIPEDENIRLTEAAAGYSWHNYGLAADVAPYREGQPVYETSDPGWHAIIVAGESLGLEAAVSHRDEPHFQLVGQLPSVVTEEVVQLFEAANTHGSGTQAVWEAARIE